MITMKSNVVKIMIDLVTNERNNTEKSKQKTEKRNSIVTESHFGSSVIHKLEDIKSSLNGLARRDLMTGIVFFQEGLGSLFQALDFEADILKKKSVSAESLKQSSDTDDNDRQSDNLHDISTQTMDGKDFVMKLLSQAKTNFELGGKKAKLASENESLSTQNRILALKFCIASFVLGHLDEPGNSSEECSTCLRQLHSLPAVAKLFRLQPQRRITATLRPLIRRQRDDMIETVCQMNHAVFMVTLLSGGNPLFWPCVNNANGQVVDSLRDQGLSNTLQELKTVPLGGIWSFGKEDGKRILDYPVDLTTNSRGEFIVADISDIKVFSEGGKFISSYFPCNSDVTSEERFRPISIASGKNGRVYVLARINKKDNVIHWLGIYVLDRHFNTCLRFPVRKGFVNARSISINSYDQICILGEYEGVKSVDVYQNNGQYSHSFGAGVFDNALDITSANDGFVMVLDKGNQSVHLFNGEGVHTGQFRIEGEIDGAMTFSHASNLLAVTTISRDTEQGQVEVYLKDGSYLHTVHLNTWDNPGLSGAAVTVDGRFAVSSKLECEVYVI